MKETLVGCSEKNEGYKILQLLKDGEDINQYEYGRTAIHSASMTNAVTAGRVLISEGGKLNLQDKSSEATALHYCAIYNSFEVAEAIIEAGGRLDIADSYGNQPLWTAVFNVKGKNDRLPMVRLFLANGADKNHKNFAGKSPYDFAKQVGDAPLISLLG